MRKGILVGIVFALLFVPGVNAEEIKPGKVGDLFKGLGLAYPTANPCLDLGEYTLKYCTTYSIKRLINDPDVSPVDQNFLRKIANDENRCSLAADYIERICEMRSFETIFKHFSH